MCFILPHFYPDFHGGAEIQCYYLGQELLARGWNIVYIHESDQTTTRLVDGIEVHGIPRRKAYLKWQNARFLREKMQEIRADVWYVRATFSYLPSVVRFSQQLGGKVLFAFSRDSQLSLRESWKYYSQLHMKLYLMAESLIFRRALRQVDIILSQTIYQQGLLEKNLGLSSHQIYNAHPPPAAPLSPVQRTSLVVWIGRIKHYKRPDLFIDFAKKLADTPIQFYLIGKLTENRLSQELVAQAHSLPHVHLLGDVSGQEIHQLLLQAKALVCTSEGEGFSNTFIEAWMRGVPVFSLQVDPDALIQEQGLGVVHPDMDQLAYRLKDLFQQEEKWREISKKCELFSRNRLAIQHSVDLLENIILHRD